MWLVEDGLRKIVACYMTFNSASEIEASLKSVIGLVDYVVVVDGAFLGRPDSHNHSYDGTIELARQLTGPRGIVAKMPHRLTEPQTRNMLAQIANSRFPGAWIFMLDADDILHDARREFSYLRSSAANKYCIATIRRNDVEYTRMHGFQLYAGIRDRTLFHPRFYRGIPGLHYAENNWTIRDAVGDRIESKYPLIRLKEAWLDHDRRKRSAVDLDATAYYNTYERWKYERAIRPLRSYIPYPLNRSLKRILRKGGLNGEALANWVSFHTLGSRTRER